MVDDAIKLEAYRLRITVFFFVCLFLPLTLRGPMLVVITVQNGVHDGGFLLGGWLQLDAGYIRVRASLVGIFDTVCLLQSNAICILTL